MKIQAAGYIRTGNIWGVPLFVHWSAWIAGLAIAVVATFATIYGPHFKAFIGLRKVISFMLCMFAVVAVHGLGHIAAAHVCKLRVRALHVSAAGGSCLCAPAATTNAAFLVYSAGLLAQLALLAGALVYYGLLSPPRTFFGHSMWISFTVINLVILAINLIPRRHADGAGTDGYVLWRLFRHRFKQDRPPYPFLIAAMASPVFPPTTALLRMSAMTPADFTTGIEVLNDATTPMLFVMETLERHLELSSELASALTWEIHRSGGKLVALPADRAALVAARMTADAQEAGHRFVCRAVGIARVA